MKNRLFSLIWFVLLIITKFNLCYATLTNPLSTSIENISNANVNNIDSSLTKQPLKYELSNSDLIKYLITKIEKLETEIQKNHTLNIVTIDVEKVIERSVAIENIKNKISDIAMQIKNEAHVQQDVFNKKAEELYAKKSNMSKNDFRRAVEKLDENMHKMRFAIEQKNTALQRAETEAVNSVHDTITKIIHQISKDHNLDLVLYKPMVLFNKDDFNMTNKVIEILNESTHDIPINYNIE